MTFFRSTHISKIELQYDPAIPILGVNQKKTIVPKDTWTPEFIAGLFTIPRTWKQPKYPLKEEWIKKIVIYIHTQWTITQL